MNSWYWRCSIQYKYDFIILYLFVCALADTGYLNNGVPLSAWESLSGSTLNIEGQYAQRSNFRPFSFTRQCLNIISADINFELASRQFVFGHDFVARIHLVPPHAHNLLVNHEAEQVGYVGLKSLFRKEVVLE